MYACKVCKKETGAVGAVTALLSANLLSKSKVPIKKTKSSLRNGGSRLVASLPLVLCPTLHHTGRLPQVLLCYITSISAVIRVLDKCHTINDSYVVKFLQYKSYDETLTFFVSFIVKKLLYKFFL